MSELQRLRDAMRFLTQHLPGATELAEIAEQGSVVLDSQRHQDAEKVLTGKKIKFITKRNFKKLWMNLDDGTSVILKSEDFTKGI